MPKRTLVIIPLIIMITGAIAVASIYVGKKLAQSQEESFTSPSIEPGEIAPEITPTEPSEIDTSNWKIYRNEEYGFEIKYPESWRIAYSIMERRSKAAADLSYTPDIDDWVMITNLIQEEEKECLQELENCAGVGTTLNYVKTADRRSMIIEPLTIPLKALRAMKTPGYETSNFRELEITSGLVVTRFREIITWEMNRDSEVAAVPYLGNKTLRDNKITFIKISIERNEGNFKKDVFNKIISGFRFF